DTSQSGQGSSQTTPQPVSAEKPIQPEAPVSPPTPSLGGSGPSSITMPNPQPDAGGSRSAPSGAEPGMATAPSVQQMLLTMGTPAGAGSLNLTPDMPAGDPAAQASVIPGIGEAMDLYVLAHPDADAIHKLLAGISLVFSTVLPIAPNYGPLKRAAGAGSKIPVPTTKNSPFGPKIADAVPSRGVPKSWSKDQIADAVADYKASIATRKAELSAFDAAGVGSATQRLAHARRITQEEGFL